MNMNMNSSEQPFVAIYAIDAFRFVGSDFFINSPVYSMYHGNVPMIVQQISNIAQFSINIMLIVDSDKAPVKQILADFIDVNNIKIFNMTEFLYFIAKLDKKSIILVDAFCPNIDCSLLTKFSDKYKKEEKVSRIQSAMVKNINNMFTNEFSEIRYEDEDTVYKDGLLFYIRANYLMHLLIDNPTLSTINLLDAYMEHIGQRGVTSYIVDDEDIHKFVNMRVKTNCMRLRGAMVVV